MATRDRPPRSSWPPTGGRGRLCELAQQADSGFDQRVLAEVFGMLERYPDRRFAAYGATVEHIARMRERFKAWRTELLDGVP